MQVLIVGNGGRESALAFGLSKSPSVQNIYISPGNGQLFDKCTNIEPVNAKTLPQSLIKYHIDLVVFGPEQPLVDGLADVVRKQGVAVFGPSKGAAQLEGSKAFSKNFMVRYNIPTASYKVFDRKSDAVKYITASEGKLVIKASGLAAGKGVLLPQSKEEALTDLDQLIQVFGQASQQIVIEERLEGEECSILAFTDGFSFVTLPALQDHKRALDGDLGPNTGGMGAYCPAPCVSPQIMSQIEKQVIKPTIDGMRRDGMPFVGMLYAGIMLTSQGIKVLEFNCRFGDPETQAVVPLIDCDLGKVMMACARQCLDSIEVKVKKQSSVAVVCCSRGYPGSYNIGKEILIAPAFPQDVVVFQGGTKHVDDRLVTSGGRVLSVVSVSDTLKKSVEAAYQAIQHVSFDGMTYRKDIGHNALNRSVTTASYADAGVSIDNGNALVEKIKRVVKSTQRPGSDAAIGGFGGGFDLSGAGFKSDCSLVAATDGVGTKLKVAQIMNCHDTIGIDLVAMNVNDLIVQGAEPLFFLDYFACGKLDVAVTEQVVSGIANGCIQAGCALIGGETAEMPGMYQNGDYDLAGFTVGAVKPEFSLPAGQVQAGDTVIGLSSSGIHSNGYSLVRHIIANCGADYNKAAPFECKPGQTLGEVLLEPTRIYIKQLLPLVQKKLVKTMAHITGGGFVDNIPRVLPNNVACQLNATQWPLPPVFRWLMQAGNLSVMEMVRTFNCGIGMVLIVDPLLKDEVMKTLQNAGENAYFIGHLKTQTAEQVEIKGTQLWK